MIDVLRSLLWQMMDILVLSILDFCRGNNYHLFILIVFRWYYFV